MLLCSEPQCANYQICLRFFQPSVFRTGRRTRRRRQQRLYLYMNVDVFLLMLVWQKFFLTCKRFFLFLTSEWSNTELFLDFSVLRPLMWQNCQGQEEEEEAAIWKKQHVANKQKNPKNNLVLLEALHTNRAHQQCHTLTWRLSGFSVLQWDQLNVLNNGSEQFKEPWSSLMRLQLHNSGNNKMSINQCHSLKGTRLNVSHLHLRH